MKLGHSFFAAFSALILISTLMAVPTYGGTTGGAGDVTLSSTGPSALTWTTRSVFGSATLQVTGPKHFDFSRTVESDSSIAFDLYEGAEDPRDGAYRWTLTYRSPVDAALAEDIQEARDAGDVCFVDELKEAGRFESGAWSGSFLWLGGELIVPELSTGTESLTGPDLDAASEGALETELDVLAKAGASQDSKALPTKDFVILDDLIVDGSGCIGFDCAGGESFGFDTIRLKEHNLRIKFMDTSFASGYPTNDWQLTANSSGRGGMDRFSIDDISSEQTPFTIEARARNHALYVDDAGRIGFGTAAPVTELHVVSGDTPTLRLEQTDASAFTPQTWDVAGNEVSFFVRDASNGSTLPFRIRPDADSNSLVIDGESQVGVGVSDATHKLHVRESGSSGVLRIVGKLENNGPASLQLLDTDSGDNWVFTNKPTGFEISKGGTGNIEMELDGSGNLTILGQLTTGMNVYPDYVFKEGYELRSLDELAAFIEENGHLPGIRSESEVDHGERVNLSELSRGLLEKVEELTLYTLQQHDEARSMRATIDEQLKRIERLEALLAGSEALSK